MARIGIRFTILPLLATQLPRHMCPPSSWTTLRFSTHPTYRIHRCRPRPFGKIVRPAARYEATVEVERLAGLLYWEAVEALEELGFQVAEYGSRIEARHRLGMTVTVTRALSLFEAEISTPGYRLAYRLADQPPGSTGAVYIHAPRESLHLLLDLLDRLPRPPRAPPPLTVRYSLYRLYVTAPIRIVVPYPREVITTVEVKPAASAWQAAAGSVEHPCGAHKFHLEITPWSLAAGDPGLGEAELPPLHGRYTLEELEKMAGDPALLLENMLSRDAGDELEVTNGASTLVAAGPRRGRGRYLATPGPIPLTRAPGRGSIRVTPAAAEALKLLDRLARLLGSL